MIEAKNIIAFGAGKGGVGKTTMTVLFAQALQRSGYKVGVLDADIYGASIAHLFAQGVLPQESDEGIVPGNFCGIQNISIDYFQQKEGKGAYIVRAPIANAIIDSFLHEVLWKNLDVLLIDLPPGTGDVALTLMQLVSLTGAIVITTPESLAKWDVRKAIQMFQSMHVPILGVIENKGFLLREEGVKIPLYSGSAGRDLAEEFALEYLVEVPFEPCLSDRLLNNDNDPLTVGMVEELAVEIYHKICDNSGNKRESVHLSLRDAEHVLLEDMQGGVANISAASIQHHCPCAACRRERLSLTPLKTRVGQCLAVTPVGSFGWKMRFTSGCSQGIYSHHLMRLIADHEK